MTKPKPPAVPTELYWSPSLHASQGWGLCYSTLDGDFVRPSTLPADAVRLVPDTGPAREPAPEQPDALLAAELRTLVKRYEALARKHDDRWRGWGVEMRDTAFCLRASLEKIEQRQVGPSGDTVQAPDVAAAVLAAAVAWKARYDEMFDEPPARGTTMRPIYDALLGTDTTPEGTR